MMRKLLPTVAVVVISIALAQTGATQNHQVEHHPDLRLEHAEVPMYPLLARTARIFGTVEVLVKVKDGKVISAEVKSGPPVLTRAAVENIQSWRFYPLVNAVFITKFTYQLEMKEPLDPDNPKVELQLPLRAKITAVPVRLDTQNGTPSVTTTH
jgi:TonB family protein